MKNLYIKFLEEFEATGLSSKRSISKFMEKNFKKPTATEKYKWAEQNSDAFSFLHDVKHTGHFTFEEAQQFHVYYDEVNSVHRWYDVVDIDARLTISGLEFLETHKSNKRIITNSNAQTLAILLTVLLTAVTLIVTLDNSVSNRQIDTLQTRIQGQTQQLHTLQIQLSQATTELYFEREAKKSLKKKP
jgi:hypothetical protein